MAGSMRSKLPDNYAGMLAPFFDQPAIDEVRATCDDCAMCDKKSGTERSGDDFFRPDLKCCTYYPAVANFLIGGVLASSDPTLEEGRRRVRAKIAERVGVTPRALAPPRKQRVLYQASRERGFGRAPALLCPYLDDEARCTIWRYRDAVCSTYYCKHVGGAKGKAFWMTLKQYLSTIEVNLAEWAAREVYPDAKQPNVPMMELTVEDVEDLPPNDEDYRSYWGEWVGREEEFYVACHEKVRNLTKAKFAELVDSTPQGKSLLAQLASRHEALVSPKLTPLLVLNPNMRQVALEGGLAVRTYSMFDPMFLTADLHEVLLELNNQEPAAETLERLGVELPEELMRDLWMHEIVVTPEMECRRVRDRLNVLGPKCAKVVWNLASVAPGGAGPSAPHTARALRNKQKQKKKKKNRKR